MLAPSQGSVWTHKNSHFSVFMHFCLKAPGRRSNLVSLYRKITKTV